MKGSGKSAPVRLGFCTLFLVIAIVVRGQSPAPPIPLMNIDAQGVGAHGFDPVAFFTEGKASQGDPKWRSTHRGAMYYFKSSSNRDAFEKDPARYAPLYGGYCAMAMAMGKLEDSDPHYFVVHDNKLLLQRNEKAHIMFAKDLEGNHQKADANWARLQERAHR